jgi:hypothetical protein
LNVAVMLGEVDDDTGVVVIVNVAVEEPAGTVILAGTEATMLLLLMIPTTVPAAETPVKLTVPVDVPPPTTLVGLSDSDDSAAGRTVMVAVRCVPFRLADITDVVFALTGIVLTTNVAVLLPAGTDTLATTCAALLLLLASVTTAPPAGAGPLSVTVAVDELPPVRLVGFKLSAEGVGALTVSAAVFMTAL